MIDDPTEAPTPEPVDPAAPGAPPPVPEKPATQPEKPPVEGNTTEEVVSAVGYWIVSEVSVQDGLSDIAFDWTGREGEPPPELLELRNRVDRTLGTLKLIYGMKRKRQFDEDFAKLLGLAQVGLAGERPAPREANAALDSLQWEVLGREGGRIKNAYMLLLGKWALGFAAVATILYFLFDGYRSLPPPEIYDYRHVFLVYAGCMAGAWASFAARKVILTFSDLGALEDDNVDPPLRLIFTAILTTILVLTFTTGFADVRIGSFHASQVLASGGIAVLIGALSGLAEKALPAAIMMRASAFLSASQSSGQGR